MSGCGAPRAVRGPAGCTRRAGSADVDSGVLRRRAERRARSSVARLGDAVGLNAAAGPFDHEAFARAQEAFWDEEVSDPYGGGDVDAGPGRGRR